MLGHSELAGLGLALSSYKTTNATVEVPCP